MACARCVDVEPLSLARAQTSLNQMPLVVGRRSQANVFGAASNRSAQYARLNNLDERCTRLLSSIEPEKLDWVMDQEFLLEVDPRRGNTSSKVVHMVKRANAAEVVWACYPSPSDIAKRLDAFAELNNLDARCLAALRHVAQDEVVWVMNQVFVLEGDPTPAMAQDAVMDMVQMAAMLPRGVELLAVKLEEYIVLNGIDHRCAQGLRELAGADVAWIMDQEFKISVDTMRGTSSAKVVGLMNRVRAEQRARDQVNVSERRPREQKSAQYQ